VEGDRTNDVAGYRWLLTWQVNVDQSRIDTCHHCKGDTWHIRTGDVSCPYNDDRLDRW
jgi:hypothetical protein